MYNTHRGSRSTQRVRPLGNHANRTSNPWRETSHRDDVDGSPSSWSVWTRECDADYATPTPLGDRGGVRRPSQGYTHEYARSPVATAARGRVAMPSGGCAREDGRLTLCIKRLGSSGRLERDSCDHRSQTCRRDRSQGTCPFCAPERTRNLACSDRMAASEQVGSSLRELAEISPPEHTERAGPKRPALSVRPRGLEPLTFAAAVRRSNPLSYGRKHASASLWLVDACCSFVRRNCSLIVRSNSPRVNHRCVTRRPVRTTGMKPDALLEVRFTDVATSSDTSLSRAQTRSRFPDH